MNPKYVMIMALLMTIGGLGAQKPAFPYEKKWKEIEALEKKELYSSVLPILEQIRDAARSEKNSAQLVKSAVYYTHINLNSEDGEKKNVSFLTAEIDKSGFPVKNILQSLLAEIFWDYYQQNRYRIQDRSTTVNFSNNDIDTWSPGQFVQQTIHFYQLSLMEADKLKKTPVSEFEAALTPANKLGKQYRPTLYDFLAHRAVDFFMHNEPDLTVPAYAFTLGSPGYFADFREFAGLKIETRDTFAHKYHALKILQDLIRFHIKDKTPDALVDVDLKRIGFVMNYSTLQHKDELYLNALQALDARYSAFPVSTVILHEIAQHYNQKGAAYNIETGENKEFRKKAFEICDQAIKRFPDSRGALMAINLQNDIRSRSIEAMVETVNTPGKPFRALITYRNFQNLYWRMIPVTREEIATVRRKWTDNYSVDQEQKFLQHFAAKQPVSSGKFVLPADTDFNPHRVEVGISGASPGTYMILFSNSETFSTSGNALAYAIAAISDIAYLHRNRRSGTTDLYITGRTTGEPLAGAALQLVFTVYNDKLRQYEFRKGESYVSDKDGYISIPYQYEQGSRFQSSFNLVISHNGDTISTIDHNNEQYYGRMYQTISENEWFERTLFFLDRAIYRPGQPLYYKGILIRTNGKASEIIKNRKLTVTFYDANFQVVSRQEVTSGEFGSFSGTFTTPSSGLMGQMYLSASDRENSQFAFRVEEYKRPRFEVKTEPVKGSYKLGEQLTIKGKAIAYSGVSIDGAAVKYRVVRKAVFPVWWWYRYGYTPASPEMEIENGDLKTAADGSFEITFRAIPDQNVNKKTSPTFIFEVTATVTDINGETHSTTQSVNIGYKALNIVIDARDTDISSDTGKIEIKTTNLSGEFETATGKFIIRKLKSPAKAYRSRFWPKPDKFLYTREEFSQLFPDDVYYDDNNFYTWEAEREVLAGNFNTANEKHLNLKGVSEWGTGKYQVEVTCADRFGETVTETVYFDVTANNGEVPVLPAFFAVKNIKVSGEPGETAKILVSSTEKVRYLFELEYDGKILEQRWAEVNNQQLTIPVPIRESHRGNITLHTVAVKNNRMYAHSQLITVPYTNKELKISFETFRDKLLPGENEQWKIKIASGESSRTLAEMVATLYDASLDAFVPHRWDARFFLPLTSRLSWQSYNGFGPARFRTHDWNWNNFNFRNVAFPLYHNLYRPTMLYDDQVMFMAVEESVMEDAAVEPRSSRLKKMEMAPAPMEDSVVEREIVPPPPPAEPQNAPAGEIKARKNFSETAFFYPHLQTNAAGELVINFTIPESLTRWKLMGLAHTPDLKSGMIRKELVTQKTLMIVPNQPRFFRENDKMIFQAKINSLATGELTGQAQLEFFDAITMQPVNHLFKNSGNIRPFRIPSEKSVQVEWNIEIPEGLQAVVYRVTARAGDFSDGEEMMLPVITNRTLVTETLPLPIRGKQTREFKMEKLLANNSTTLKHHRYTLEFTSNPAWYAIQALPYLIEFPFECTEQIFSRYYANSIATHIVNSSPAIKQVFDTWSKIQPEALLSNLEKNQELKTALLRETPWVLNAASETQRKRNIALLFDLNSMAAEQDKAMNKILETQLGNGGFPWFPGLPEDLFITQYIVAGVGHMEVMGIQPLKRNSRIDGMVSRAVAYMDMRMNDRYRYLVAEDKKGNLKLKDNHLSHSDIQYLYARSFFRNIAHQEEHKEAFAYWNRQASQYWPGNNLYAQGMIALAAWRNQNTAVATEIVKSLRERALHSEELGMYWKHPRGYFWYEAPVETQALMVEVFDEVAGDPKAVEDLKVWLLKQKQTQDWQTTKATAEACYALLRRGTDILSSNKLAEITVGDEKIDPAKRSDMKVEAGTGYIKTAWTGPEITPEMGKIRVKKTSDGVAWGAVYWQYFEQLDKITPAETPLKLSKQLFRQEDTDRGPVITPITQSTPLRTGDLVRVRIELRSDRTMEYIHLKDMRASAFEPVETLSGYRYQDGLWYYQSPGDMATNFFIGYLPKGTYVFEYSLRVSQAGDFSNGITTVQCMYAPEFSGHSEGVRVKTEK